MGILSNILALQDRWLKVNVYDIAIDSIESEEDKVVEYNKEQLRERGERPDGTFLKPYAPSTISVKQAEGKEWRFRTLTDTGSFQNAFSAVIINRNIDIDSSDSKTAEILEREGDVFGFTSENKRRIWAEVTRPYTIDRIKQITGAK